MERQKMVLLVACALLAVSATSFAGEEAGGEGHKKGEGSHKAPPPAEEVTLTGKLSATTRKMKDKEVSTYLLTDEQGNKHQLPAGGKDAPDLSKLVDKNVKLVAMAIKRTQKGKDGTEKTSYRIQAVKSIEEAAAGGGGEAKAAEGAAKEEKKEEKKEEQKEGMGG